MTMSVYKTLDANDIWKGVVCSSPEEARLLLGAFPDVMLGRTGTTVPEYAPLWASPGKVFVRAYSDFPRLWELLPEQDPGPC